MATTSTIRNEFAKSLIKGYNSNMSKILTIDEIKKSVEKVAKSNNLKKVTLFGSYANGTPTESSDIDVLVEFANWPVCMWDIAGVKIDLEDETGKNVDVLTNPIPKRSLIQINKEVLIYGK